MRFLVSGNSTYALLASVTYFHAGAFLGGESSTKFC